MGWVWWFFCFELVLFLREWSECSVVVVMVFGVSVFVL